MLTAWHKVEKIDGKHTLCGCSRVDYIDREHYMNQSQDTRLVSILESMSKPHPIVVKVSLFCLSR